jgi:putative ATPase
MIEGGEDARFIARRMIVFVRGRKRRSASTSRRGRGGAAVEHVGLPEARLNLAQATVYREG